MSRVLLRGSASAITASRQTLPSPALNGVWRRTLSSNAQTPALSRIWWATSSPTQVLRRTGLENLATAQNAFRQRTRRGFRFTSRRGNAQSGQESEKPLSLGQRLKKLSREYGWAAVGVYFGLSVLDFPFCFLFVRIVGTERIGKVEHYVVSKVKELVPDTVREQIHHAWRSVWATVKGVETKELGSGQITGTAEMAGWGVEEAQERNQEEASLATQLALAYAIHKSFIFVRVPLTAAVTPKVVKTLRSWGWNIGKRKTK